MIDGGLHRNSATLVRSDSTPFPQFIAMLHLRSFLLVGLLGLFTAIPSLAQGGDTCANAQAISGEGTWDWDASLAANSQFDGGGTCMPYAIYGTVQDVFFQWTATQSGDYLIFLPPTDTGAHYLILHEGVGCAATCWVTSHNCLEYYLEAEVPLPNIQAGQTVLVQIVDKATTVGTLTIQQQDYPCSDTTDDSLEDNDNCQEATFLSPGFYAGLFVSNTDRDVFALDLPAGHRLEASGHTSPSNNVPRFRLYNSDCEQLVSNWLGMYYRNTSGAPMQVNLEMWLRNDRYADPCAHYDLDIRYIPDPCAQPEDTFGDIASPSLAAPILDGSYPGLFLDASALYRSDWFQLRVKPGGTLTSNIRFDHSSSNLDLELYELDPVNPNQGWTNETPLAASNSYTDDEQMIWTNDQNVERTLHLRIWNLGANCTNYDLALRGVAYCDLCNPIGSPYCDPAVANSSGVPGRIQAFGNPAPDANDLMLRATDLPNGQIGYFIGGTGDMIWPRPGSIGFMCLIGGAVLRFKDTLTFTSGGQAVGRLTPQLPNTEYPTPMYPGANWGFQFWHRDVTNTGASVSNFTDAVRIDWQ